MNSDDIERQNQALMETSRLLFGDSAFFEIVNPGGLCLLKHNARYFKKETYKQLVANIKQDERLSSVPLCHISKDDSKEVLSGNHRVKASIQAGIPWIMVIVLKGELSESHKIAVQLSHNALVGQDDAQILAQLWAKIETIKEKLYAGLSSDTMAELENVKLVTFSTPQVYTKPLHFIFTTPEKENLEAIIKELSTLPAGEKYLISIEQFDSFFSLLQEVKKSEDIKNGSLAMLKLVELAGCALREA